MAYNSLLREERPDFKAYNNGFASLNNVELLSIIIGQGNDQSAALQQARQLLNMCGGKLHDIANRRAEEYEVVQGVGPKKALTIQAAFELAKRIEHEAASECEVFDNRPSRDDDSLTLRLKKACETMRIFLVDHVIVTDRQYYSYNEEGRM